MLAGNYFIINIDIFLNRLYNFVIFLWIIGIIFALFFALIRLQLYLEAKNKAIIFILLYLISFCAIFITAVYGERGTAKNIIYYLKENFYGMLIIYGPILIIFLFIQLLLCFKAKRIAVKLILLYPIAYFTIFTTFLTHNSGGLAAAIGAAILMTGIAAALLGVIIAWVIYGIYYKKRI